MNDTRNESAPDNPMGTDGFEFVEYTAPNPELLGGLFEQLGFSAIARHRSKDVRLIQGRRGGAAVAAREDALAQEEAAKGERFTHEQGQ